MQQLLKYRITIIVILICIATFFCFSNARNNQFSCWDDDYYVTNDPYIRSFSPKNLKTIFTEDITKNNYHPFCMLSLAINYHFSQLNPQNYYLTNVAIHVINAILVFFLFLFFCRALQLKENNSIFIAGMGSLWFAIHPMHVESVGWIAERKDVLYAFFYFLGLIVYIKYTQTNKVLWYWLTFLLFICSCLSKPMAVVFPVSLFCIDILIKRKWKTKVFTEKAVFFLISLLCGAFAVYTQNKAGAIADFGKLTLSERIMYAAYGFDMYIYKFFDPSYLSTFYPYPYRYITGYLPAIYYEAPFIAILLPLIVIFLTWKFGMKKVFPNAKGSNESQLKDTTGKLKLNTDSKKAASNQPARTNLEVNSGLTNSTNKKWKNFIDTALDNEKCRVAVFGFGYFFTNVVFVLQFISVGAAIMADRYSYVSYVGLLFMVFYFVNLLLEKLPSFKIAILGVISIFSFWLSYLCYERNFVWHDSETLLSDAIEKYPMRALLSYKWLGNYYLEQNQIDKALENYNVLSYLRAADAKVYDNIGVIYNRKNMPDSAIEAFDKSIAIQNNVSKTYLDRSQSFLMKGDSINAKRDYAIAMGLNPVSSTNSNKVYEDLAFNYVQNKQYEQAIKQYDMLLKLNNTNAYYYFYRGVALYGLSQVDSAIADWEIAVKMNNIEVKQSASNNLSVAYDLLNDDAKALYYAEMSLSMGYKVAPDFIAKLKEKKKAQGK